MATKLIRRKKYPEIDRGEQKKKRECHVTLWKGGENIVIIPLAH